MTQICILYSLILIIELGTVITISCISCSGESVNSSCYKNPNSVVHAIQTCKGDCQVWSLVSEVNHDVYMFERSCSEDCKEGCTHIADMQHRFTGCGTCCSTAMCNKGNGATAANGATNMLLYFHLTYIALLK